MLQNITKPITLRWIFLYIVGSSGLVPQIVNYLVLVTEKKQRLAFYVSELCRPAVVKEFFTWETIFLRTILAIDIILLSAISSSKMKRSLVKKRDFSLVMARVVLLTGEKLGPVSEGHEADARNYSQQKNPLAGFLQGGGHFRHLCQKERERPERP